MTTLRNTLTDMRRTAKNRINWRYFLQDNITGSWWQMLTVAALTLITAVYTVRQLESLPWGLGVIVLVAWVVGLLLVIGGELRSKHHAVSRWLKKNLFNSVTNSLLTLFLTPILYFPSMLPAGVRQVIWINPFSDLMAVTHGLVQGSDFRWLNLVRPFAIWLLLLGPAWLVFRRSIPHIREVL